MWPTKSQGVPHRGSNLFCLLITIEREKGRILLGCFLRILLLGVPHHFLPRSGMA